MPRIVDASGNTLRHDTPYTEAKRAPLYKNERAYETIAPQQAPDAPRQGDTPARPARRPVFLSLAIAAIQSVSQQEHFVRMDAPSPSADMPRGAMHPWDERVNIERTMPNAYGSSTTRSAGLDQQLHAGVP